MKHPNMLIIPAGDNYMHRNMTAEKCAVLVLPLPSDSPGSPDSTPPPFTYPNDVHLMLNPNKPRKFGLGESGGMLGDWSGQFKAMSFYFRWYPWLDNVFSASFGEHYRMVGDRGAWRQANACKDNPDNLKNGVHGQAHVDFPEWTKLEDARNIPWCTIVVPPHHVAFVALDQAMPHSIGVGGGSGMPDATGKKRPSEPVLNWFTAPLSLEGHMEYERKTMGYISKDLDRERDYSYCWRGLKGLSFPQVLAACIAYGIRPPLFSSAKPIQMPPVYSGPTFVHFRDHHHFYHPDPSTLKVDTAMAYEQLHATYPGYAAYFEPLATDEFVEKWGAWAMEPHTLAESYLRRYFGVNGDGTPIAPASA